MIDQESPVLEDLVSTENAAALLGYASSKALHEQLRRGNCPLRPWRFHVGGKTRLRWSRREIEELMKR